MSAVQRASDGVSGEYAPAPADHPFLRRSGGGLDGLDPLGDVERREQAAMIHAGATVFDHMPHGSFFHATGGSVHMGVGERLKLIPYETAVGLTIATVSTLMFGVFGLA